jgi:hypothetical protein
MMRGPRSRMALAMASFTRSKHARSEEKKVRPPGIEPGAFAISRILIAWEAKILPLNQERITTRGGKIKFYTMTLVLIL